MNNYMNDGDCCKRKITIDHSRVGGFRGAPLPAVPATSIRRAYNSSAGQQSLQKALMKPITSDAATEQTNDAT